MVHTHVLCSFDWKPTKSVVHGQGRISRLHVVTVGAAYIGDTAWRGIHICNSTVLQHDAMFIKATLAQPTCCCTLSCWHERRSHIQHQESSRLLNKEEANVITNVADFDDSESATYLLLPREREKLPTATSLYQWTVWHGRRWSLTQQLWASWSRFLSANIWLHSVKVQFWANPQDLTPHRWNQENTYCTSLTRSMYVVNAHQLQTTIRKLQDLEVFSVTPSAFELLDKEDSENTFGNVLKVILEATYSCISSSI